jgi:hypothetical protein
MATKGILSNLKNMALGLKGDKPTTFGVDPIPPASLHLTYSTNGNPNVKWRTNGLTGMKPAPTRLSPKATTKK